MKAFLAAVLVMALVAVAADVYLETLGFSSANTYSAPNVRLGE
jgi:hypothetical protein